MTDQSTAATTTTTTARKPSRIIGLDIARAFAIVGMVIVNFKVTMGADTGGPRWLNFLASLLDGRAAATFVILAGIGASLGSRTAREGGDNTAREGGDNTARQGADETARRGAQITLARRALFLFVLGWAFYPIWPADILHFYGVYLAVGAVVLFAPGRRLITLAAAATAIALAFVLAFDPLANWNLDDYSYRGISTPVGFIRNLFFDGFHPVFPWVAFYLFGMWLGRADLRNPEWRRLLAIRAGVAVAVCEVAAWFLLGPKGASLDDIGDESWRWLFSVQPLPPFPLYLVAGAGTAILVIVGSIWLGEHLTDRLTEPLVSTGQLALTIYLAHVFFGMGILEAMGRLEHQSLEWAVSTGLAFSAAAITFSWAWRRRFRRGPLEWVMRRVAG